MKINAKNIVRSFFIRAIFTIILMSIISSISIYYFQQYNFYTSLANEIKTNVDKRLHKYDQNLALSDIEVLEEDVRSFMQELDFIMLEVYDNEKNEFYAQTASGEIFEAGMELIKRHDDLVRHRFPESEKMSFEFIELSNEKYFIQIFYPIYKSGRLLGYIEGISYVEPIVVDRFKRGLFAVITIVVLTIIIFSFIIFPLIYFAYKQLNRHRLELLSSNIMMIHTLGNAIALRDNDTDEHNYRVTLYAIKFAESLNVNKEDIQKLIKGAFLHDIGKIGISDNILLKKGELDENEFEIMSGHVKKGAELVHKNSWLDESKDIILYHHEKYNGSGYPNGVKGSETPLIARVFTIVDVFDALTSKRPYKEPYSYEKSINILKDGSNIHFDGELLEKFLQISNKLYIDINQRDKSELKKELDSMIEEYFL